MLKGVKALIIRNGFIRNACGEWMNLTQIKELFVTGVINKGYPTTFIIKAYLFGDFDDDYDGELMSEEYDDLHEAQCALDDAFGFTG